MTNVATITARVTRVHPAAPPVSARAITRSRVSWLNPGLLCVVAAAALSLIGVVAISTTQSAVAARQSLFLVAGMLAAGTVAFPHYGWLRRLSYPLLLAIVVLLIFVLIPFVPDSIVRPRNGARRWINVGFTDFQPSELAKIAFILALANYLRSRNNYRRILGLLPPFVLTFVPMGLILIEPDLGTSLLFLPTLFAMLIAAGARKRHIALIVGMGLAAAPLMYPFLQPYQQDRIKVLIAQVTGDERHRDDIGFQSDRAMTLVAAGQLTGVGREAARDMIRFNRLPEHHNDMVFAVVMLRWGMLGGLLTIGAYLLFAAGGIVTAARCRDPFGRLVAVGIVAIFVTQMAVNMGMTIGLLPITGMTLPFVSYGGSSLIANWLMTGLLVCIALRRPRPLERESFDFNDEGAA